MFPGRIVDSKNKKKQKKSPQGHLIPPLMTHIHAKWWLNGILVLALRDSAWHVAHGNVFQVGPPPPPPQVCPTLQIIKCNFWVHKMSARSWVRGTPVWENRLSSTRIDAGQITVSTDLGWHAWKSFIYVWELPRFTLEQAAPLFPKKKRKGKEVKVKGAEQLKWSFSH